MPTIKITLEPRDIAAQTLRRESVFPVPEDGMIVLQLPTQPLAQRDDRDQFITAAGRFILAAREGMLDAELFETMAELYDKLSNIEKDQEA